MSLHWNLLLFLGFPETFFHIWHQIVQWKLSIPMRIKTYKTLFDIKICSQYHLYSMISFLKLQKFLSLPGSFIMSIDFHSENNLQL